jgi:excisionase family DNA binding protein
MPELHITERALLTVPEAAERLGVSQCWVRRHVSELPAVRLGRLVRFDSLLLGSRFRGISADGNSRKPESVGDVLPFRRYQAGYIYKTGRRVKVWYGRYREDVRTADGQIVRRTRNVRLGSLVELPTRTAAQNALSKLISKPPSAGMTFRELVDRWEIVVAPTIQTTTAEYYKKELRNHVVPAFGARKVSSIGRYDVESFLAERAGKFCRNTLRGMRVSLGRVLGWAVACGWLERNPCAGVKLPQAGQKVVRNVLSPEQTIAIAGKLREPYSTLVLFLAVTGLRVGEAVGIQWGDFDGNTLHVSRRIYEGKAGAPKTKNSERYLPIPEPLLARMRALGGREWVFESRAGTPVNPTNALRRYVRPAAKELKIPLGGWHDLRHSLVTHLRRSGWDAKTVAEIVGHSSPTITETIYHHVDRSDFRAALDEMAAQLLRDVTKCTEAGAEPKTQVLQ